MALPVERAVINVESLAESETAVKDESAYKGCRTVASGLEHRRQSHRLFTKLLAIVLNTVVDDRGTAAGQPDPAWNGTARHMATILDDYHYVVEVAVPWREIGLEPQDGQTVIGIDLCVNGKDPATGEYDYFDWCGLPVFHDPSGFGDLVLAGSRNT